MTTPSASVIVLSYNTRELTVQCLAAFAPELIESGWQIIVVDNASDDGSIEAVQKNFPLIEIVRSERNLGFAGGNNLGLRHANGEFVFLINSDVIASTGTLQEMLKVMQAESSIGAMSAGLLTTTGEPQDFAFGGDPNLIYLLQRGARAIFAHKPMHDWSINQAIGVDWVSGACLCVRQAAIQRAGLLDECFQLYFEDNDWCLRIRQAGWRIVYDPRFKVTHLGGASLPQRQTVNKIYYRSLRTFYAKHYGPVLTLLLQIFLAPYQLYMALRR
jgi:N-acetylglucosaminyl-diphospho-decaprenol L-rhamnosyltransferase